MTRSYLFHGSISQTGTFGDPASPLFTSSTNVLSCLGSWLILQSLQTAPILIVEIVPCCSHIDDIAVQSVPPTAHSCIALAHDNAFYLPLEQLNVLAVHWVHVGVLVLMIDGVTGAEVVELAHGIDRRWSTDESSSGATLR